MAEMLQNTFSDYDSVSDYAKEAIVEMVGLGIVEGYNGMIMPKNHATREESAMMIYRLLQKID